MRLLRAQLILAAIALCSAACRGRPADLREWRPSDHTHDDAEAPGAGAAMEPVEDNDPMIAAQAIWQAQCSTCHGPTGHGDGPQAALVHPADLTTAVFQSTHTDAQIRTTIVGGRNLMPAFGAQIRPEGIDVLVRLVRSLGAAH